MVKRNQLARTAASCGLVLLIAPWSAFVLAGPCLRSSGLQFPDNCRGPCLPNVCNFGYFRTTWREWPGEPRPDKTFPQSIGAEVLPTPKGQEQLPVPKAAQPLLEPTVPPDGGLLPVEPAIPLEPPIGDGVFPGLPPATEPLVPPGATPTIPGEPGTPPPVEPPGVEPSGTEPPAVEPPGQEPPAVEPPPLSVDPVSSFPSERSTEEPLPAVPNEETGLPRPSLPPVSQAAASRPAKPQIESPSVAAEPPPEAPVQPDGPGVGEVADAEPPPKPPPSRKAVPKAPRANWMAALHPGFRGDAPRPMATYGPTLPPAGHVEDVPRNGRTRAATHQTAVDSRSRPGVGKSQLKPPAAERQASHTEAARQDVGPPVALDGFCPVELADREHWVPGDPRIAAVHQGHTYLFSNAAGRKRFLADPKRYTPMFSGEDPVLAVDGQRHVRGQTDYCVTYKGRLYMFSSAVTLARFQDNPKHYAKVK